jgi:SAM-dependent methyltransferase
MNCSEKLLVFLSTKPGLRGDSDTGEWDIDNALSILDSVFPYFSEAIKGKEILDFGCGSGFQSLALAKNGAKLVLGVDINENALERARDNSRILNLSNVVSFANKLDNQKKGEFDIIISQNSFEHFNSPAEILNEMKSVLKDNGIIFITFGPPWFAPYGSHTQFFARIPWVNLFFKERVVIAVRSLYRNDGARKYEEVEGGLNKMTVNKFEKLISDSGLKIKFKKYDCIKKINFMGQISGLRELFINRISCILTKA